MDTCEERDKKTESKSDRRRPNLDLRFYDIIYGKKMKCYVRNFKFQQILGSPSRVFHMAFSLICNRVAVSQKWFRPILNQVNTQLFRSILRDNRPTWKSLKSIIFFFGQEGTQLYCQNGWVSHGRISPMDPPLPLGETPEPLVVVCRHATFESRPARYCVLPVRAMTLT